VAWRTSRRAEEGRLLALRPHFQGQFCPDHQKIGRPPLIAALAGIIFLLIGARHAGSLGLGFTILGFGVIGFAALTFFAQLLFWWWGGKR